MSPKTASPNTAGSPHSLHTVMSEVVEANPRMKNRHRLIDTIMDEIDTRCDDAGDPRPSGVGRELLRDAARMLLPRFISKMRKRAYDNLRSAQYLSANGATKPNGAPITGNSEWDELMRQQLVLPDGTWTFYYEVTVEILEQAIDNDSKTREGLQRRIDNHQRFIDAIKAHGVTRLGQVPPVRID